MSLVLMNAIGRVDATVRIGIAGNLVGTIQGYLGWQSTAVDFWGCPLLHLGLDRGAGIGIIGKTTTTLGHGSVGTTSRDAHKMVVLGMVQKNGGWFE